MVCLNRLSFKQPMYKVVSISYFFWRYLGNRILPELFLILEEGVSRVTRLLRVMKRVG
jgi:hypothetical protein